MTKKPNKKTLLEDIAWKMRSAVTDAEWALVDAAGKAKYNAAARKVAREVADSDWLERRTGKGSAWWLKFIGDTIAGHAFWGKDKVHQEVELSAWLTPFCGEVERRMFAFLGEKSSDRYDGNMAFAATASFALMKWFVRLVRAKAYDPRRRLVDRRRMLKSLAEFCREVVGFMADESEDHRHFPKQKWDPPFAPGAKNGSYR